MSVVNQMLKDLDRRQVGDQPIFTQHVRSNGSATLKIGVAIGLLLIGGLIVTIFFLLSNSDKPQQAKFDTATLSASAPINTAPVVIVPIETEIAAPPVSEPVIPTPKIEAPLSPPLVPPLPRVEAPAPKITAPLAVSPVQSEAPKASDLLSATNTAKAIEATPKIHPALSGPTKIDVRPIGPSGRTAEEEFRRAVALLNEGRAEEARASLTNALKIDPRHEGARQTLAVLLIEIQANEAAEAVLAEGLRFNPNQVNFAVLSARLKLIREDTAGALEVLRQHGAAGVNNADYRAFTGALFQRLGRHTEAIEEYRAAVALAPAAGVWWMGLGISYEAAGQSSQAIDAFKRAQASNSLSPDLTEFVERKLQTIR